MVTGMIRRAVRKAPLDLIKGIEEVLEKRPDLIGLYFGLKDKWDGIPEDDRERIKDLGRIAADIAING